MAYSISNLQNDLAAVLHGQTINQIFNFYGLVNRAGHQLLLDVDPMETKRASNIAGTVFNSVYDYPVPVDLKGNKVIDIYPQVNRYPTDVWLQLYNQYFDRTKSQPWATDTFTINFNTGIKSMRISAPFLLPPITLDTCSSTTGSGNWTVGGGASNLTTDNVNYVANGGSLRFNLDAGQSTGNLSETLSSPINLQNHLNQSTLFLWTYLPTPSSVTAVTLRWGTNSSNYYQVIATTTQQNTAFQTGWNLLPFPWLGATVVGTPDPSSIQYLDVIWSYDSTLQTSVRLDNIQSNLGSILNIEYYSKYIFRSVAGIFQENALTTTDLINLDTDAYNLLFFLTAHYAAQQQQGISALFFDSNYFLQKYNDALALYKAQYKSEIQLPQNSFYTLKRGGYDGYVGIRWIY